MAVTNKIYRVKNAENFIGRISSSLKEKKKKGTTIKPISPLHTVSMNYAASTDLIKSVKV